jgi:hypothetical protein
LLAGRLLGKAKGQLHCQGSAILRDVGSTPRSLHAHQFNHVLYCPAKAPFNLLSFPTQSCTWQIFPMQYFGGLVVLRQQKLSGVPRGQWLNHPSQSFIIVRKLVLNDRVHCVFAGVFSQGELREQVSFCRRTANSTAGEGRRIREGPNRWKFISQKILITRAVNHGVAIYAANFNTAAAGVTGSRQCWEITAGNCQFPHRSRQKLPSLRHPVVPVGNGFEGL